MPPLRQDVILMSVDRLGDDAVGVKWMDIDSSLKLYASHVDLIRRVVERWDAYWE